MSAVLRWIRAMVLALSVLPCACDDGGIADDDDAVDDDTVTDDDTSPDGDDDVVEDDDTPSDEAGYQGCDVTEAVATFTLAERDEEGGIFGYYLDYQYYNVPVPAIVEGACTYYTTQGWFCDPPCETGEFCGFDHVCHPQWSYLDIGTITFAGSHMELESSPDYNHYYRIASDYEGLYAAGDPVTMTTGGSEELGSFVLQATGTLPLASGEVADRPPSCLVVERGAPVEVWWEPEDGSPDDRVLFEMEALTNYHAGGGRQFIRCEVLDTEGQITVPSSMVDEIYPGSYWTTLSARLSRLTRDKATTRHGCVELVVTRPYEIDIILQER